MNAKLNQFLTDSFLFFTSFFSADDVVWNYDDGKTITIIKFIVPISTITVMITKMMLTMTKMSGGDDNRFLPLHFVFRIHRPHICVSFVIFIVLFFLHLHFLINYQQIFFLYIHNLIYAIYYFIIYSFFICIPQIAFLIYS